MRVAVGRVKPGGHHSIEREIVAEMSACRIPRQQRHSARARSTSPAPSAHRARHASARCSKCPGKRRSAALPADLWTRAGAVARKGSPSIDRGGAVMGSWTRAEHVAGTESASIG
jgi:hypothetical protein